MKYLVHVPNPTIVSRVHTHAQMNKHQVRRPFKLKDNVGTRTDFFLWTGSSVGLGQELKVVKFWRNPKIKALGTSVKVGLNTSVNKIILCECYSWTMILKIQRVLIQACKLKNWKIEILRHSLMSDSVLGRVAYYSLHSSLIFKIVLYGLF